MIVGLQLIEKEISRQISDELDKVGILYRLFSRSKTNKSAEEKIERKISQGTPYAVGGKLIQDVIGIRIVTYFKDDIDIVYQILKKKLNYLDEEIDNHDSTVFKPKRTNIICGLKKDHKSILNELKAVSPDMYNLFDDTFELQLRTILSEGWHEIDHSLRYKCKGDWSGHEEKERMLNGIYASLETNDLALKSLFNELAYNHYKNKNWEGVLRNKFRLKFNNIPLKPDLIEALNQYADFARELIKFDRDKVIKKFSELETTLPISFNNIIYILNAYYMKNEAITKLTPNLILENIS